MATACAFLACLLPMENAAANAIIAQYRFDNGTLNDSSGNNYTLASKSPQGKTTTSFTLSPALGDAFAGTCGYRTFNKDNRALLALPASFPNLGSDGNAFTISAWIKTTDNRLGQRIFVDDAHNSTGYGFSLSDNGNVGMLRFFTRGTPSAVTLDTTKELIKNNTWYFVAAVADVPSKTKHIYVYGTDGKSVAHVYRLWTEDTFGSDDVTAKIDTKTSTIRNIQLSANRQFPYESPSRRFFVIPDHSVVYFCYNGGIYRSTPSINIAPPPGCPTTPTGASLLANQVSSCSFMYAPAFNQRNGLVSITLQLAQDGETVTLYQEVLVPNAP